MTSARPNDTSHAIVVNVRGGAIGYCRSVTRTCRATTTRRPDVDIMSSQHCPNVVLLRTSPSRVVRANVSQSGFCRRRSIRFDIRMARLGINPARANRVQRPLLVR